MPEIDPYRTLADLLRSAGARPIVSPERVVPSAIYDFDYRVSIIACAFELHAKTDPSSATPRIQTARLKLLQFVAVRPWLLSVLNEWAMERVDPQRSLMASQRLRRGYLGDATHDRVVEYLVARGCLVQGSSHLGAGANVATLMELSRILRAENLFPEERRVLAEVANIKITNAMLEGW